MEGKSIILVTVILAAFLCGCAYFYSVLRLRTKGINAVKSSAFITSVLQSVDNVVNYYEPIYDNSGNVSDFVIIYANECNREYFGLPPEEITGRPISEVFPYLFLNGEFDGLVECLVQQKKLILQSKVQTNGTNLWFKTILKPLSNGVSVTARNMTVEIEAKKALTALNKKLKFKNRELGEAKAFLDSIFNSTDSIINYMEPIQDGVGNIKDFEIILMNYASEAITGKIPEDYVGTNLSEVYPEFINNGIFDILLECGENGITQRIKVDIQQQRGGLSYSANAVKTNLGITLTLNRNGPKI